MGVKDSFLGKLLGSADKFSDKQVAQTISMLIEHGVRNRASDIHIEPHERFVLVRYRIDGTLKGIHKLPIASLPAVSEQIKTLAHLSVEDDCTPQEGQYATLVADEEFEVQVTILPVIGGEKIVLHLSRRLSKPLSLEALGFWGKSLQIIRHTLNHSHGLIVVATPRRNGKTTTLHSMLQILNTPTIGISTVESAIEYRLPGANQTLVRPKRGITFHDGLRAALSQDPNIVMVSDLPDKNTAELAIQAAMSGHLVMTGIHSDTAISALTHLRTMSNEAYLLAASLRTVCSQRLVRQLCIHCRERYIPSSEQIAQIEKTFGITGAASRRKIHELEQEATQEGVGHNKHVNTTPSKIIGLWRASEEGCDACGHTGYQGVIAIVEALQITDSLQKSILDHSLKSALYNTALKDGFIPMGLDGVVKALRGQTTIAEVLRTTSSQNSSL